MRSWLYLHTCYITLVFGHLFLFLWKFPWLTIERSVIDTFRQLPFTHQNVSFDANLRMVMSNIFFAVKLMPDNTCHYGRSGGYLVTFNHFISFSLALVKGKQWSFLLRDSVDNHLVCTNILLHGPNLQPFTWLSSETHGSEIWLTGTVPKALTQGIIFGLRIQILRI